MPVRRWLWLPTFARMTRKLRQLPSPADRRHSGAGDLDEADFAHQRGEGVDLVGSPGHFENEAGDRRIDDPRAVNLGKAQRSEEHTSELQSLMRTSYAVFCLKKKNNKNDTQMTNVK